MQIGVTFPQTRFDGDPVAVRDFAQAAEDARLLAPAGRTTTCSAPCTQGRDPELWGPYTEHDPFHEPFVLFGYLAAITKRIELGTGVLILPQRQTALVAKQAAEVDLLSGGRLRLGVGTGWNYVEYESLNEDFSNARQRVEEQVDAAAPALERSRCSTSRVAGTASTAPGILPAARPGRSRSGSAASKSRRCGAPPASATASSSPGDGSD